MNHQTSDCLLIIFVYRFTGDFFLHSQLTIKILVNGKSGADWEVLTETIYTTHSSHMMSDLLEGIIGEKVVLISRWLSVVAAMISLSLLKEVN